MTMSATLSGKRMWIAMVVILVVGIAVGKWALPSHSGHGMHGDATPATGSNSPDAPEIWTCSMHPQIQQPGPGKCPLCGMDLILLETDGEDLGPRELRLSETARMLAKIQVRPVTRRTVTRDVHMVGSVTFDETRLVTITAWIGGRMDRLFVDYTGVTVKPGDHMVWMYSPEILAAQEELIQAGHAITNLQDSPSANLRRSAQDTLEATRDRLRLWGLTAEQVQGIETSGKASDHIQINAPIGGIVVQKNAQEGSYVKTGTQIYQIADLSQVWVKLDAYESDLAWLRYGQQVTFATEAYPGETFEGRISFIDPVLTERTRTVKVRINVPNESGLLKPGMFVRAVAHAQLAGRGRVIDPDLAGKWISPMHPEIVRDEPGDCPVCGMALEKAEALGYVDATIGIGELPLVIPRSAALITGRRAVVYVQHPDDPSLYDGREIVLGPRAGDYYIVESGLKEGELVVTSGAFKIDSALQIQAKPSMMNPTDETSAASTNDRPTRLAASATFTAQLRPVFERYTAIHAALAADNLAAAKAAAGELTALLADVDMTLLSGPPHMAWMKATASVEKPAVALGRAASIDLARGQFERLSVAMIDVAQRFGTGLNDDLLVAHCPMAFENEGADWLQLSPTITNPYFGGSMLGCGDITDRIAADTKAPATSASPAPIAPQIDRILAAYFAIQVALSKDQHAESVAAANDLSKRVAAIDMTTLNGDAHTAWMKMAGTLRDDAAAVAAGESIAASREAFLGLSETMMAAVEHYGGDGGEPVYVAHCPMAFGNTGADWLQSTRPVANPYFGAAMYGCGEVTKTLRAPTAKGHEGHDHE